MPDEADPTQEPLLGSSSHESSSYGTDNNKAHDVDQNHTAVKVVHFTPDDPEDPRNWPRWKKWLMIGPILLIDLSVSWGASGFSPASKQFAEEFGLPAGMGTLGLSSYILGLAFGPMTLAPLSEVSQPQKPLVAYFLLSPCWSMPTDLSILSSIMGDDQFISTRISSSFAYLLCRRCLQTSPSSSPLGSCPVILQV